MSRLSVLSQQLAPTVRSSLPPAEASGVGPCACPPWAGAAITAVSSEELGRRKVRSGPGISQEAKLSSVSIYTHTYIFVQIYVCENLEGQYNLNVYLEDEV